MNWTRTMMAALAAVALLSAPASAQIRKRQENQQRRIATGVGNGSLTAGETAKLERKESVLNKEVRKDRVDGGGLSAAERKKIDRQQDRLSKQIYKQKHDAQKR